MVRIAYGWSIRSNPIVSEPNANTTPAWCSAQAKAHRLGPGWGATSAYSVAEDRTEAMMSGCPSRGPRTAQASLLRLWHTAKYHIINILRSARYAAIGWAVVYI